MNRPFRRGRRALALGLTAFVMLAGACSSTSDSGGHAGGGAPVRGGTLTVGLQVAPKSLDPLFGNAPDLDRNVFNAFYQTLVRIEPGGKVADVLASRHTVSADGRTYTFTLRQGVTFGDGTPFDADAVVFNLKRVTDPANNSPRAVDLVAIDTVTATDPQTVTVTLKQPTAAFLAGLAGEAGMMVSPTAAAKGADALQRDPVGTGPFVFDGFLNGADIKAKRNPAYWEKTDDGGQLPYFDAITFRVIPDANVKMTDLKTGGVQLIDTVPIRQAAALASDDGYQLIEGRGVEKWMAFNTTRAPFDDVRVRQAVAYAIDRNAISSAITNGQGSVPATLCTKTEICYDDAVKPTATDAAKARSLLAEAGRSSLTVTVSVINREPDNTIAQLVQAQLKEVGVTVNIQTYEREKWINSVLAHDFDLATLQIGVPRLDPSLAFNGSFLAESAQNWAGVNDPDLFAAVGAANAGADPTERRADFARAQQILLEKAYYVFFYWNTDPAGASARLHGVTGDQSGAWNLTRAWLTS
ncbi:ABC transporter substrate-binding protein [Phytohabitans sp. ZYX-F-186]|uniref:ABC transporter substrate-binding protein n=1 Tax=Phytohabitans maris TaxID=3071409 RepID=A0ABU0ZST3_9ACTN|nr:ABC transporter substrate-binding protein [Phytohabitans sp. ZYX-F-186]MDQ7910094.1 ABC transporter substrate-binding protein [Phytohabitans sp. ZYX-F-186]